MKKTLFLALMLIGIFGNQVARASGDDSCYPVWSLTSAGYDPCNSVPFLSPANDTRINLRLLMADSGDAEIPAIQLAGYDRDLGYGLVPFSSDVLLTPPTDDTNNTGDTNNASDASSTGDAAGTSDANSANADNDYATGQGTRCSSNNKDTAQTFIDQVNKADGLSSDERAALIASRQGFVSGCDGNVAAAAANVQSPMAKDFALYLTGAQAFYAGNFQPAHQAFAGLANSSQPWLKETALYLVARTALNAAQVNAFDESGFPKIENVDQAALKDAQAGFNAYLQAYPQGLYAASARGLLRRVYWLTDDEEHLAGAYGDLVAHGGLAADQVLPLVQEADNKLLATADAAKVKDPVLLAIVDLMAMRSSDTAQQSGDTQQGNDAPAAKTFTIAMLQAQQPLFADHQELYAYLQAAEHFYVEKDPALTLAALPDVDPAKPITTYLAFSEAMLRGLALEAKGDSADARALWTKLIPPAQLSLTRPAFELALAANEERARQVDAVFAADSPVQSAEIRLLLLRASAGPALLRQQIKTASVPQEQRDTALFVLLFKDLTRGHYQDFAGDLTLAPLPDQPALSDQFAYTSFGGSANFSMFTKPAGAGNTDNPGYSCPVLAKVAARLQQNKNDPLGLNCLGEFIRSSFDFSPLNQTPTGTVLGAGPSDFDGKAFSRLDGYMTVIGDAKASRTDKAYALYRAINCYAPSASNECDSQDIPKDQRKKWFQTLKSTYADTSWGRSLQYYW